MRTRTHASNFLVSEPCPSVIVLKTLHGVRNWTYFRSQVRGWRDLLSSTEQIWVLDPHVSSRGQKQIQFPKCSAVSTYYTKQTNPTIVKIICSILGSCSMYVRINTRHEADQGGKFYTSMKAEYPVVCSQLTIVAVYGCTTHTSK